MKSARPTYFEMGITRFSIEAYMNPSFVSFLFKLFAYGFTRIWAEYGELSNISFRYEGGDGEGFPIGDQEWTKISRSLSYPSSFLF